jgi:asparagine synthase (glutamine-hydrolysing)
MCGIAGAVGTEWDAAQLEAMVRSQWHRGPDDSAVYRDPSGQAGLGHNRLSIIDLSPAGRQPMCSLDKRYWIVFNGEIYNYIELRSQLAPYHFRSCTDTEVILAAYERWGAACLDRFIGMFAFLIWDEVERRLFAARDRFGVKPLCYAETRGGGLLLASEPGALRAAGVPLEPDEVAWATYLARGLTDYSDRTFWKPIRSLPAGHKLTWEGGRTHIACWYDLADRVGPGWDDRPLESVEEEYLELLKNSVKLRFRADVPVGINLSGGLDSSTLLGLVQAVHGPESDVKAFTFITGDPRYDELPWVEQILARTKHPSVICRITPEAVPDLAAAAQRHQDAPFGGLPTLAYGHLFARAHAEGVIVLLDGQGMDEQWAGYDYYTTTGSNRATGIIQGTRESALKPACLTAEFRTLAEALEVPDVFSDHLRQLQYRDVKFTKIPRALRFNDRVSMQHSTELREPFLDHRLFELALRQPTERKLQGDTRKWLLRDLTRRLLPAGVVEAPKRPLQTPQREWLRERLREWAEDNIAMALEVVGGAWLEPRAVREAWQRYLNGESDNSFYVWQWINLGLMCSQLSWSSRRAAVPKQLDSCTARSNASVGQAGELGRCAVTER